jgi:polysaccharide export outer membrane protein
MRFLLSLLLIATFVAGTAAIPHAQSAVSLAPPAVAAPPLPPDYVIGPEDVLSVVFWRDKDLSGDVIVRPDGNITLPVLNDIRAAGLTPAELQQRILAAASHYFEDPAATVVVKEIKSRKVFITGQVQKPGPYPLVAPMTVVQLIAIAGGLQDFAKGDRIVILRRPLLAFKFNYDEFSKRKHLLQNIELQPGDTVIVP